MTESDGNDPEQEQTGSKIPKKQINPQAAKKDELRIGVYICHCGLNIAGSVDCEEVAKYAEKLPGVVVAKDNRYTCSDPGQELIKQDIKESKLNRVVVASCTPRLHEPTFRKACEDAGLNPYLFEMANIREHCSWVHLYDKKSGTEKAKDLVKIAVAKVSLLQPQIEAEVPIIRKTLVIGGGVAGIQASLDLADAGYKVYMVEKEPSIGGRMAQIDKTFPTMDCSICILAPKMSEVGRHPNIEMMTNSEVTDIKGYIGNFKVTVHKTPRYVTDDCTACGDCTDVCPVAIIPHLLFQGKTGKYFAIRIDKHGIPAGSTPQRPPPYPVVIEDSRIEICSQTSLRAEAPELFLHDILQLIFEFTWFDLLIVLCREVKIGVLSD